MKSLSVIFINLTIFFVGSLISYSQTVEKLPAPVNSDNYQTVSPYMSYDGKNIVFVAKGESSHKLAEYKINNAGSWEGPFYIDAVNNFDSIPFLIEAPAYNHNTSEIYFSLKHDIKDANADIYVISKVKGKWSLPEKLPAVVNTKEDETDPFLSFDGKQLFFARGIDNEQMKRFDCFEILVSEKTKTGWDQPVPLPSPVNDGCDRSPRMAQDGKTLYFSSVRGDGKTFFDIYYAKKITKNAWTSPVQIDTVNNLNDDMYPSVPLDGEYIYYQVGEGKKKERTNSLVRIKQNASFKPEKTLHFFGKVTDLQTDSPLPAKINIIDPNTSIILFETKSDELTGKYQFYLQKDKKYRIDFYNDNYSHYFHNYETKGLNEFASTEKNVKLYSDVNLIVNIYDNEIYEPLNSLVKVYNNNSGELLNINAKQIDRGRYRISLPIGSNYKIEAEKEHFDKNHFLLDLGGVIQFSEFERELELQVKKIDYIIKLSDEETGAGVETEVEIVNLSTNEKIVKKVKTDKDGRLKIKLRDGTRYEINVSPKGYAYYNTIVDLVDEKKENLTEAKLTPLKKATKLELNDIIFETNSADLNKSSFEELDRVVQLLINNPQIKIEISAHTDDVGSKTYNLKLSDRRAESVKEYLFKKEVSQNQTISKGYGESKPKYLPAGTDENRAKNRRVEIEVIEINE